MLYDADMKTCSKCGLEKELAEFYRHGGKCKKCRNDISSAWAKANPEKVIASRNARKNSINEKVITPENKEFQERFELRKIKKSLSNKKYQEKSKSENPERFSELRKAARKRRKERDPDLFRRLKKESEEKAKKEKLRRAAYLISSQLGIPVGQIPEEFITVKHAHLTLLREIRKARKDENTK